jgi:hypothetical protein
MHGSPTLHGGSHIWWMFDCWYVQWVESYSWWAQCYCLMGLSRTRARMIGLGESQSYSSRIYSSEPRRKGRKNEWAMGRIHGHRGTHASTSINLW